MAAKREETCRNCRQTFLLRGEGRHAKRLPFLLACGHTLCGVCISAAGRKAGDLISCTDCGSKNPYNSSESVEDQFVPNLHLLGLITARHLNLKCTPRQSIWNCSFSRERAKETRLEVGGFQPSLVTEAKCEECNSKAAEKKCIQCDGFFCDTCFKIVHAAGNTLRKHRAIPAYQASSPPPTCPAHLSRALSYYCRTEGVPVCPDCIIQAHKDHDVVAIEEAVGECRNELQALIGGAQSTLASIQSRKQEVEAGLLQVCRLGQAVSGSMEQQMRELCTLLQKREQSLHSELARAVELQAAPWLEMDSALDADMSRVSEVLASATDVIKCDVRLLQNLEQLRVSLEEVKGMVLKDVPNIDHTSFQLSAAVREAINTAGDFKAGCKCPEAIVTGPTPSPDPPPASLPDSTSLTPMALPFSRKKSSSRSSSVVSSGCSRSGSLSRPTTPVGLPRREETVPVWVSHVESPTEFYVQFKAEEEDLQNMALKLNETMNCQPQPLGLDRREIHEEMKVAAIFSEDEMWYRGKIVECHLDSSLGYVGVFYLDYGNTENVGLNSIAKLPTELNSTPFFAHGCALGIKPASQFSVVAPPSWGAKSITQFKNVVTEDSSDIAIAMKEVCRNAQGCREVEMFTVSPDGALLSVAERLLHMGLAARPRRSVVARLSYPPPLPRPKSQPVDVTVSCCASPSRFHVQLTKDKKMLKSLGDSLKEVKKQKVYFSYKGLVCMAQSVANKKYYRAVITDTRSEGGGKSIRVQFVDCGTQEWVNEVLELDPAHLTLPSLAIHCKLHNVLPVQGSFTDWPQEVIERFRNDTQETVLEMLTCAEGEPLGVELTNKTTRQSLNSMLVVEGLARLADTLTLEINKEGPRKRMKKKAKGVRTSAVRAPTNTSTPALPPGLSVPVSLPSTPGHPLLKTTPNGSLRVISETPPPPPSPFAGQTLELTVVQVHSPGEFYVQSQSYLTEVQPLLAEIPQVLPTKSGWQKGEWCLAPFQGERWYRGQVERRADSGFEVMYLDFGNRGVVSAGDLAPMTPTLRKIAPQAMKVGLAGVRPVDDVRWGFEASVYFSSLVLDQSVTATVQAVLAKSMLVHVNANGRDVGQSLLLGRMARPDPALLPLPPSGASLSTSSEGEGEARKRGRGPAVGAAVVTNGGGPQENGHVTSPLTISIASPGSEVNPVSPEGPPPSMSPQVNGN